MRTVSQKLLFLGLFFMAFAGTKVFAEYSQNYSNVFVGVGPVQVGVSSGSTSYTPMPYATPYYGGGYQAYQPVSGIYPGYTGSSCGGGCGSCGGGCGSHGAIILVPVQPRPVCGYPTCGGGYYPYPYPMQSSFSSVRVAVGGGFLRGFRPVRRPVRRVMPVRRPVKKPMYKAYYPMY